MRSIEALAWVMASVCWVGCSSGETLVELAPSCTVSSTTNVVTASTAMPTGDNVMKVTVNGSECDSDITRQYPNEPCVSVQVCTPGGACATIKNLLLDTGSYGLRVYESVLTAAGITPTTISTGAGTTLAECVGFGDGSSEWGQIGKVDMILANETKISNVPIHMIKSTFSSPPSHCSAPDSVPDVSPAQTGFSGILGVGLFEQDCGSYCVSHSSNGMYYSCSGTSCTPTSASLSNQVQNPVSMLATDNNGVMLMLPEVPAGGSASVTGYMVLGIDTQSNNASTGFFKYGANTYGEFTTVFNPFSSNALPSFIDSGSSLIFFPWPPPAQPEADKVIPDCGSGLSGFYCPASLLSLAATNRGEGGTPTSCVGVPVANAATQFSASSNMVYSNLAGSSGGTLGSVFDWGLPFFLGRKVFVGIEHRNSSLGTGPYWSY